MSILDTVRSRIIDWLLGGTANSAYQERVDYILQRRDYRHGQQKRFIKVRANQADDNLVVNFTDLILSRSISLLFGKGVEFDFGEEVDNQEEGAPAEGAPAEEVEPLEDYIDAVWEANNKDILLHKLALNGGEAGQVFVKIVPREGDYPRLIALDPAFIDIVCDPDDLEQVVRYIIQYKTADFDGQEVARREITDLTDTGWVITTQISKNALGHWENLGEPVAWEFDFPPILSWQNLPNPSEFWGMPDLTDDVITLQDRFNFIASNMSKIIRLYAHPQRYGRMLGAASQVTLGPDDMPNYTSPDAAINQLSPVGDLPGSTQFMLMLRQAMFDITRTVDISSMADRLGALTNFGLRVLYQDALGKMETKRRLYGWGLRELNRRLLVLAGMDPATCEIIWEDPLPVNETEQAASITQDLNNGLVSKQTASELQGYSWEDEEKRLADEKASQTQASNIGAQLLMNAFNRGQ